MNDHRHLLPRAFLAFIAFFSLVGLLIFLPAGFAWTRGWTFWGVFLVEAVLMTLYMALKNPEIIAARSRVHKGTKPWDRVLFVVLQALILAMFPIAGYDYAGGWSSVPRAIVIIGYILFTLGMLGNAWVLSVNKFAEMTVRIQTERGHRVVDWGPYAIVRHPMYATIFPLFLGMPLAMGSYWALIPAVLVSLGLLVRTVFEDRLLERELPGYKEYAQRVRYRILPGVW